MYTYIHIYMYVCMYEHLYIRLGRLDVILEWR